MTGFIIVPVVLLTILAFIEIARTRARHTRWDKEIAAEKESLKRRFEEQQLTRSIMQLLSMHSEDTNSTWYQKQIDKFLRGMAEGILKPDIDEDISAEAHMQHLKSMNHTRRIGDN